MKNSWQTENEPNRWKVIAFCFGFWHNELLYPKVLLLCSFTLCSHFNLIKFFRLENEQQSVLVEKLKSFVIDKQRNQHPTCQKDTNGK